MSAVAAGVAVAGLTDVTGSAASGAPVVLATPSASSGADTAARDQRVTRGDTRPQLATAQQRKVAAQQAALLGDEGRTIAVREAEREAKRVAAAKKKKALAAKKAAAKKKAERARIKKLGYEPGTTDPRDIARQILKNKFGYGDADFRCFDDIIIRESNWDIDATNPSSGAYGIPQALPGSKMASVGSDWRTDPATQITWAIGYMNDRYGSPCSAWSFKSSHGWY